MASVVTLSEDKIQELMAGWQAVADRQDALNAEITELKAQVETYEAMMLEFTNLTLPQIQAIVAANSIETEDMKDNAIPNLELGVDENAADLVDLNTVTLPAIQNDLSLLGSSVAAVGVPYRQDEPPLDDDPDNPILIGTRWYDTNDDEKEYSWNGTEWVESGISIPDLSLTAKKFKTSTHMIY